jgi:hypothetical protein
MLAILSSKVNKKSDIIFSLASLMLERGYTADMFADATLCKQIMPIASANNLMLSATNLKNSNTVLEKIRKSGTNKPFFKVAVLSNSNKKQLNKDIDRFFTDSAKENWFDKTIFVITSLRAANSANNVPIDIFTYRSKLLLYAPKIMQPRLINKAVSQLDIAPMISGILGFDYITKFSGVDALSYNRKGMAFMQKDNLKAYLSGNDLIILTPAHGCLLYSINGNNIAVNDLDSVNLLRINNDIFATDNIQYCSDCKYVNIHYSQRDKTWFAGKFYKKYTPKKYAESGTQKNNKLPEKIAEAMAFYQNVNNNEESIKYSNVLLEK